MDCQTNPIEILTASIRAALGQNNTSFAELSRIEGFAGNDALTFQGDYANIVLWPRISSEAAEALTALVGAGECHLAPATLFTYLADGIIPWIPVARQRRAHKTPHWLPVVLHRGAPTLAPRCRSLSGPRYRPRLEPAPLLSSPSREGQQIVTAFGIACHDGLMDGVGQVFGAGEGLVR
ncbi:MAG: hypothetical protein ACREFQ_11930, partial [Stellaceae bacterium]